MLDEFKSFVKKNPNLIKHVNNGSMTWQKFYEMYDLYGEENDVWKDYIKGASVISLTDLLSHFKNINLDSIQNGVNSIQKVLGILGDVKDNKTEYKSRPIYKHFDD